MCVFSQCFVPRLSSWKNTPQTCNIELPLENGYPPCFPTGLKRQLSFPQPGHPPPPKPWVPTGCRLQRHKIFSAKNAPTGAPKPRIFRKSEATHGKFVSLFVGGLFFFLGGGVQQKKTHKKSVNQHGLSCWLGLLVWAFLIPQKSVKGHEQKKSDTCQPKVHALLFSRNPSKSP